MLLDSLIRRKAVGARRGVHRVAMVAAVGMLLSACAAETAAPPEPEPAAPAPAPAPEEDAAADQPVELEKVTIRGDFFLGAYHAPYFVAADKGWYAEEGLEVEFLEGQGSAVTVQTIAQKRNDFGFAAGEAIIGGVAQGADVQMIANIFPDSGACALVRADSGITTPQDFVGRSYGTAAGATTESLFRAFLRANGVDAASVQIVNVDRAAVLTGYVEGLFDAAGAIFYGEPVDAELRFNVPSECILFSDYGIRALGHGLITHRETIESRPEVVAAFTRATLRAFEWTFENPGEALDIMRATAAGGDRLADNSILVPKLELMGEVAGRYRGAGEALEGLPIGSMSTDLWQETVDTLRQNLNIQFYRPVEDVFTNEFIPAN